MSVLGSASLLCFGLNQAWNIWVAKTLTPKVKRAAGLVDPEETYRTRNPQFKTFAQYTAESKVIEETGPNMPAIIFAHPELMVQSLANQPEEGNIFNRMRTRIMKKYRHEIYATIKMLNS